MPVGLVAPRTFCCRTARTGISFHWLTESVAKVVATPIRQVCHMELLNHFLGCEINCSLFIPSRSSPFDWNQDWCCQKLITISRRYTDKHGLRRLSSLFLRLNSSGTFFSL